MVNDPDDRAASTLAGIRERYAKALIAAYLAAESEIVHPDDECGIEAGGSCTAHGALEAPVRE